MTDLKWGIIGCGDVCERKAGPPLYQLPNSQLIAVTRRDQQAGTDFAERHGPCRYVSDVDSLLTIAEIDAIYVATPDALHHAGTLAALAAGKHVLVEKAMASDAGECDDMIAAAESADRSLAVAYYRRCYPSIERVAEMIHSGAIGDVQQLWLNDQFPTSHRIDLAHYLCGSIARIRVDMCDLEADANAAHGPVLTCEHINGARSRMAVGWNETHDVERLVIDGSAGRIVIHDLKAGSMSLVTANGHQRCDADPLPFTHWGLMANFIAHIRDGAALACDGIEGRRSTVILDAIEAAPADGSWSLIDY